MRRTAMGGADGSPACGHSGKCRRFFAAVPPGLCRSAGLGAERPKIRCAEKMIQICFGVILVKNTKTIVGAFLALFLSAGCVALVLFFTLGTGPVQTAASDSVFEPEDPFSVPVLNRTLLALLDGDNSVLRDNFYGRCYAETTQRGTARLTYLSPYLSIQFKRLDEPEDVWLEGNSEGFYDENPFVDELSIIQIDLCEEIDPKAPALERHVSLRQLIQTNQPITYTMLCEVLEQTPELKHRDNAYYDGITVSEGISSAQKTNRIGERINGGEEEALFVVDGVKIRVSFINVEDEQIAFFARLEKAG